MTTHRLMRWFAATAVAAGFAFAAPAALASFPGAATSTSTRPQNCGGFTGQVQWGTHWPVLSIASLPYIQITGHLSGGACDNQTSLQVSFTDGLTVLPYAHRTAQVALTPAHVSGTMPVNWNYDDWQAYATGGFHEIGNIKLLICSRSLRYGGMWCGDQTGVTSRNTFSMTAPSPPGPGQGGGVQWNAGGAILCPAGTCVSPRAVWRVTGACRADPCPGAVRGSGERR
jgi:hypothetical protein